MPPTSLAPPPNIFDDVDDDDDGWQDMPVVREDEFAGGLDEEDQRKYHYQPSAKGKTTAANATGNLIDVDDLGNEWRSKIDQNESEYTRLRVNEEEDADEVHLRTKYLFDEDKAMTPLSQMQATKNLLTEAQRIAYVGLCALTCREMLQDLKTVKKKELKAAITNTELWALKIMGRLYYHMELETQEQKMIESLADHGVIAMDLVPALMTTHTVANPEYDPAEAQRQAELSTLNDDDDEESISDQTLVNEPISPIPDRTSSKTPTPPEKGIDPSSSFLPTIDADSFPTDSTASKPFQTTTKVLKESSTAAIPGVTTSLSAADEKVTLDIRWTVLCDLFLILIADSVYDARSRVLLEHVAMKLGLGWLDVVKFESRITEALEIQEDVESLEQQDIVEGAAKAGKRRRYMMLGLATIGGGLVIGLSAGLLAPVIGLGLAGALTTVGVTGTGVFLGGTAGAAVITTGGVLTGSGIAARGMAKRTKQVRTFDILPLHNNKRVNCILTVPGFMTGLNDDVRLPFSVLDPIVGDVFSVLWEPDMIRETGSALKILTGEVLSQIGLTVLQATVMTGLMSALQWPIILTKLGYLIDNPWSNALDRAKGAGRVLADVLIQRNLGVRPITLIGFSLGARVIFYALVELAKQKQFGIVQDVFLLGATLTASQSTWCDTRSVVSGRYVNAFAKNDWVLNYLFRATSGGVGTVAGLRAVENVPGLENVDVTDKIAGHMSYRTFMPLILDQLGFPVFSDFFDEPEEPDFTEDRVVVREEENQKKSGWFGSGKRGSTSNSQNQHVSRPPSTASWANKTPSAPTKSAGGDDELPPRMDASRSATPPATTSTNGTATPPPIHRQRSSVEGSPSSSSRPGTPPVHDTLPKHAGFDLQAMKEILSTVELNPKEANATSSSTKKPNASPSFRSKLLPVVPPSTRSQSTPPVNGPSTSQSQAQGGRSTSLDYEDEPPPRTLSAWNDDKADGLGNAFSRSMSLSSPYDDPAPVRTPRPGFTPLSAAADGVVDPGMGAWGSPPSGGFSRGTASSPPPASFGVTNSFGRSTTIPTLGPSSFSSFAYNANGPSSSSLSLSKAPGLHFGAPSPPLEGLAFGSADGTITNSPISDP